MKKTGLGGNPLEWIKDTKKEVEPQKLTRVEKKGIKKIDKKGQSSEVQKSRTSELPKFRTYIKHSVLLSQEHLDHLHNLERAIMAQRKSGKERITKNSILRCYIDVLSDLNINLRDIQNETELLKRIKAKFRSS
ncbi:MAG: hypothetical protein ABIK26_04785 [Candidatus Omnitrophota bacterium]